VTLWKRLGIGAAGAAAIAFGGAYVRKVVRRWKRKSPDEIEQLRRNAVNACGRIAFGRILELADPVPGGPIGPILLYEYEVAGVTYEAAQNVSVLPEIAAAAPFLPGQTTSVKYDPKQPTNSILACEGWCGIPDLDPQRKAALQRQEAALKPPAEKPS
jgi:hypothetical protein